MPSAHRVDCGAQSAPGRTTLNTIYRFTTVALAASFLVVTACEKGSDTDISTIIARHTEARGGADALAAVNAIQVRRRVEEGKRHLITNYVATRDGRVRIDVFDDGRPVLSEGYDGKSAWQEQEQNGRDTEMPDWALAAVQRSVRYNLYNLNELAATGTTLKLAGRMKDGGVLYWVIDATDADGYKQRLFIDPTSFLIAQVQENGSVHPDRNNYRSDIATYYSDFRRVDGVIFSFKSEIFSGESGVIEQKAEAMEIIVNPTIDPSIFSRPAAVPGQ